MVNDTGAEQFAVIQPAGTANRFDAVFGASTTAVGLQRTVSLPPNGLWPAQAGTITAAVAKGAGTFPDGATASYTPGSSTPVTINYQPSADGEHALSFTNTAGLYTPYNAPLNSFPSSSGTAQMIAANTVLEDQACHQRDVTTGIPNGFSFSWPRARLPPGQRGHDGLHPTLSALAGRVPLAVARRRSHPARGSGWPS